MAHYELLLPKMGESVAEATVIKWLKKPGDAVSEDDAVLEIATDKVDSEVPSPVSGRLLKQLVQDNDVVQVGEVLAIIEVAGAAEQPEVSTPAEVAPVQPVVESPPVVPFVPEVSVAPAPRAADPTRFYSPLVKNIAAEEGISLAELDRLSGSGAEGRVTKQDVLDYVAEKKRGTAPAPKTEPVTRTQESPVASPVASSSAPVPPKNSPVTVKRQPSDEIIEMDRMRKIIAEHMVSSKQIAPHVTSFVEADVTNIVKWREKVKASFEKREGEKITYTPIFIEAVARAIKEMPMVNVSVEGTQIIKKRDINIGMAAALPSGNLIVPVIRNADQLNLVGITKTVNDLAHRARNNKLQPDEIKDGTFTITNVGSFGNVMGTPIINQPQVAILAVGVIKKKPAVIETPDGDLIGIRHMMFLSLSYDHRVVDGALGGSFLRRVADYLEDWDVNREV